MKLSLILGLLLFSGQVFAGNNIHLIDSDDSGFAIYRTSRPSAKDMELFCKLGIQEMMVLSGSAEDHEWKYQSKCPTLKVIYNEAQNAKVPMTASFLADFDSWVEQAKATGKKIAFRCSCGCHRTGRLAAYYQMKYQNLTASDAIVVMKKWGKYMFLHPQLKPQVYALEDHINGRLCSTKAKHCVIN